MLRLTINLVMLCIIIAGFNNNLYAASKKTHSRTMPLFSKQVHYRLYGKTYSILNTSANYQATGLASWYGKQFHHKYTSSGERFDMFKLTAAHKTLPLRTRVRVTNLLNGRQVTVKVNDRGPFVRNRIIDLSYAAAKSLGMLGRGIAPVRISVVT